MMEGLRMTPAFYDLDGRRHALSAGEYQLFLAEYEDSYYIDDQSVPALCCLRRTNRAVEEEIEGILDGGFKGEEDVKKVLAWKVGRVDHRASGEGFVYTKEWQPLHPEAYRGRRFDFDVIVKRVLEVQERGIDDPDEIVAYLAKAGARGVGPVYLLTLLYFLTRGRHPIYDHYAAQAANALCEGVSPGAIDERRRSVPLDEEACKLVRPRSLPEDPTMLLAPGGAYQRFVEKVEGLFGREVVSDASEYRRIDRALWVYGHRFPAGEHGCC